jgi:dTDP-4-amino-4,6-dideoxygalactose transaminase/predicted RNA methylase
MRNLVSPVKAIFNYRALFRSLWRFDWESEWREHFGAHSVSGHPSGIAGFRHIVQILISQEPERTEFILPAYICPSRIEAVQQAGLTPVLIDMEPMTPLVSMASLRAAINERTLAVVTSNLYGAVDPIEDITAICRENGVFLIEDVSMALGCDSNDKELGLFGDVVFLSFGPGDVITTINGGMVCWRNATIGRAVNPPVILDKIDWRALWSQIAYPLRDGTEVEKPAGGPRWSLQQARLSALLLPLVEDDAGERRDNCHIIKRYQSKHGYDMVGREANPKLTQYPCLAASEAHREEILGRLHEKGIVGGRGLGRIATVFDDGQLPNTVILISRLYTLPCHPGISRGTLNRMLSQINQSDNAFIALVKDRYSNLVERYGPSPRANGDGALRFRVRRRLISDQIKKLPGGDVSVLDSGCGNGALGPVFRSCLKIASLDGADFVSKSLEIAKTDFGYSRTYLTNVTSINAAIEEKRYDLVNCSDVITFIPPDKYPHFFSVHRRCVADGRHFLLTFPNTHSVYRRIAKSNSGLGYNFSYDEVLEALRTSGFKVTSIIGSDIFGLIRFNLNNSPAESLKRFLSCEISILCEAC